MICYALALLKKREEKITLYEVLEKDLKELPESSLKVIYSMGTIKVVPTDMRLEIKAYNENDSLRSPRYIYNLGNKFGKKRCALCGCEIPELVQGAHIWPVANIKREVRMSFEDKLKCATDGENGLWLCENHHKLFDTNIITLDTHNGSVLYRNDIDRKNIDFLHKITPLEILPSEVMTDKFVEYLWHRNQAIGF
ncbi:MAG: HNH endonuclease signature motif containing protein [Eubacteriales bacterium]|nr:HNH endonuclease signature motif containing protein [Eubacteriales bacterium]